MQSVKLTFKAPITTILSVTLKVIVANSVDPDQTAPLGAVWSGSTLFAYMQNVSLKSLQEAAAVWT